MNCNSRPDIAVTLEDFNGINNCDTLAWEKSERPLTEIPTSDGYISMT